MITNNRNLPDPVADLVRLVRSRYVSPCNKPKCITVTQLVDAPQVFRLKQQHPDLPEDVNDLMASTMGTLKHQMIEELKNTPKYADWVFEKRLDVHFQGWQISGQFDMFHPPTGRLLDFKYVTTSMVDGKTEWRRQLNLLKWLIEHHAWSVTEMSNVLMFRNWSQVLACKSSGASYPSTWSKEIKQPAASRETIERWLTGRLKELEAKEVRECTYEEKYGDGGNWAAMKKSPCKCGGLGDCLDCYGKGYTMAKRASKTFVTTKEYENWVAMQANPEMYTMEARRPKFGRCECFCSVRHVCQQARNEGSWPPDGGS